MVYFCCVYRASISPLRHGRSVTSSWWNWPDPNLHQRTLGLFETLRKTVLTWTVRIQSASIVLKCARISCLVSKRNFLWFHELSLRVELNWKENASNIRRNNGGNFSFQNFMYWYSLRTCLSKWSFQLKLNDMPSVSVSLHPSKGHWFGYCTTQIMSNWLVDRKVRAMSLFVGSKHSYEAMQASGPCL